MNRNINTQVPGTFMTAGNLHTLGRRYSLRNLLRSLAIENSEGQPL